MKKNSGLNSSYEVLDMVATILIKEKEQLIKEKEQLIEEKAKLISMNSSLEKEIADLETKVKNLEDEKTACEEQVQSLKISYEKREECLKKNIEDLETLSQDLISDSNIDITNLKNNYDSVLGKNNTYYLQKIEKLESENKENSSTIKQLSITKDNLEHQIIIIKSQYDNRLKITQEEIESLNATLRSQKLMNEAHVKSLLTSIENLKNKNLELITQITQALNSNQSAPQPIFSNSTEITSSLNQKSLNNGFANFTPQALPHYAKCESSSGDSPDVCQYYGESPTVHEFRTSIPYQDTLYASIKKIIGSINIEDFNFNLNSTKIESATQTPSDIEEIYEAILQDLLTQVIFMNRKDTLDEYLHENNEQLLEIQRLHQLIYDYESILDLRTQAINDFVDKIHALNDSNTQLKKDIKVIEKKLQDTLDDKSILESRTQAINEFTAKIDALNNSNMELKHNLRSYEKTLAIYKTLATGILISAAALLMMFVGAAPLAFLLHTFTILNPVLNAAIITIPTFMISGFVGYKFFKPKESANTHTTDIAVNPQNNI